MIRTAQDLIKIHTSKFVFTFFLSHNKSILVFGSTDILEEYAALINRAENISTEYIN